MRRQAEAELASATPEQRASLSGSDPIARLQATVRAEGSAGITDTLLRGISAVSAPIFDHAGRVCAVLTALNPASMFDIRPGGKARLAVVREARDISAAMGFKGPAGSP